ncbi:uncharacterized threonine-rich GPI-anchored glycoprotein PJ4664.02-like [Xenia sp. Carnegie-2017]|uniref:uncharacterized threonine-rich GPI-anchored glycoprotein PJ4664.02-like n=1 Tax=Xenia sp. Carnegie-2017 TaxID=2897299 RepID=UPI001F042F56|nr:uncharacterized threonine-rich GPI-anchored glycoprotein PJ4664.02-like [Xenia sp. Carnegie-2017]
MTTTNIEEISKSEAIVNHERYIDVPRGWNRCLENGNIVYFSPSQVCLKSKEDIAQYLVSDKTCKCGIDCPLFIDKVFEFDASILSRHFKLSDLEKSHNSRCKETIKAQCTIVSKVENLSNDLSNDDVKVFSKPLVVRRKAEVSKKKNESPKLPLFESILSAPDAVNLRAQGVPNQEVKSKKTKKSVSQKKKSCASPALDTGVSNFVPQTSVSQTVQLNSDHFHAHGQHVDAATYQFSFVPENLPFSQKDGSFAFPSSQFNATSFLASLSSATTTISSQTCPSDTSSSQKPYLLSPKQPALLATHNQSNNLVYFANSGNILPISNQNPMVSLSGASINMVPQVKTPEAKENPRDASMSKPGYHIKNRTRPIILGRSASSRRKTNPQDLSQTLPNQSMNSPSTGKIDSIPSVKIDKQKEANIPEKQVDPFKQPLQYCGILLQPGVVPPVHLPGANAMPNATNTAVVEQSPYVYTLQGLPYASNVSNSVVGMTSNNVVPYFLGFAQPGNPPKPVAPNPNTPGKDPISSSSTTNTPAIAAAYSAFVSIAPASVTNSSFSQQLVNLVSNYNNPYWQHLLTQGVNANTLAYQLSSLGQYPCARTSLPNGKPSSGRRSNSAHTKVTSSTCRSGISSSGVTTSTVTGLCRVTTTTSDVTLTVTASSPVSTTRLISKVRGSTATGSSISSGESISSSGGTTSFVSSVKSTFSSGNSTSSGESITSSCGTTSFVSSVKSTFSSVSDGCKSSGIAISKSQAISKTVSTQNSVFTENPLSCEQVESRCENALNKMNASATAGIDLSNGEGISCIAITGSSANTTSAISTFSYGTQSSCMSTSTLRKHQVGKIRAASFTNTSTSISTSTCMIGSSTASASISEVLFTVKSKSGDFIKGPANTITSYAISSSPIPALSGLNTSITCNDGNVASTSVTETTEYSTALSTVTSCANAEVKREPFISTSTVTSCANAEYEREPFISTSTVTSCANDEYEREPFISTSTVTSWANAEYEREPFTSTSTVTSCANAEYERNLYKYHTSTVTSCANADVKSEPFISTSTVTSCANAEVKRAPFISTSTDTSCANADVKSESFISTSTVTSCANDDVKSEPFISTSTVTSCTNADVKRESFISTSTITSCSIAEEKSESFISTKHHVTTSDTQLNELLISEPDIIFNGTTSEFNNTLLGKEGGKSPNKVSDETSDAISENDKNEIFSKHDASPALRSRKEPRGSGMSQKYPILTEGLPLVEHINKSPTLGTESFEISKEDIHIRHVQDMGDDIMINKSMSETKSVNTAVNDVKLCTSPTSTTDIHSGVLFREDETANGNTDNVCNNAVNIKPEIFTEIYDESDLCVNDDLSLNSDIKLEQEVWTDPKIKVLEGEISRVDHVSLTNKDNQTKESTILVSDCSKKDVVNETNVSNETDVKPSLRDETEIESSADCALTSFFEESSKNVDTKADDVNSEDHCVDFIMEEGSTKTDKSSLSDNKEIESTNFKESCIDGEIKSITAPGETEYENVEKSCVDLNVTTECGNVDEGFVNAHGQTESENVEKFCVNDATQVESINLEQSSTLVAVQATNVEELSVHSKGETQSTLLEKNCGYAVTETSSNSFQEPRANSVVDGDCHKVENCINTDAKLSNVNTCSGEDTEANFIDMKPFAFSQTESNSEVKSSDTIVNVDSRTRYENGGVDVNLCTNEFSKLSEDCKVSVLKQESNSGSLVQNKMDDKHRIKKRVVPEALELSDFITTKRKCVRDRMTKNHDKTKIGLNENDVQNGDGDNSSKQASNKRKEEVESAIQFTTGDIVWAQARGLPSWPGKIVDERDVANGKAAAADTGKKWVMWFGDHTFSQVEVDKLKTLTEGLKTLDDKGKKKKHRGKKTRVGLEQAIGEALEEQDQKDRLRTRQGSKAKKRRF